VVARRGAEHGIHRALKVHRRAQLSTGAPSRGPEPGLPEDQIRLGADPCGGRAAQAQPRAELGHAIGVEDLLLHLGEDEQRHPGDESLLDAVEPAVGDEEVGAAEHGELFDVRVRGDARGQRPERLRGDPPNRVAKPIPRAAPVTRATLLVRSYRATYAARPARSERISSSCATQLGSGKSWQYLASRISFSMPVSTM
jgi:hypothetical protein